MTECMLRRNRSLPSARRLWPVDDSPQFSTTLGRSASRIGDEKQVRPRAIARARSESGFVHNEIDAESTEPRRLFYSEMTLKCVIRLVQTSDAAARQLASGNRPSQRILGCARGARTGCSSVSSAVRCGPCVRDCLWRRGLLFLSIYVRPTNSVDAKVASHRCHVRTELRRAARAMQPFRDRVCTQCRLG